MRVHPAGIVVAFGLAPLVWAACGSPPEASSPGGSSSAESSAAIAVGPTSSASAGPNGEDPKSGDPKAQGSGTAVADAMPPDMAPKGPAMSKGSCEALLKKTVAATDAAEAAANSKACATDADCAVVMDGYCMHGSCGASVVKSEAASFTKTLKAASEPACSAWYDGGCPAKVPVPMPSCPMYVPECKAGRCTSHY